MRKGKMVAQGAHAAMFAVLYGHGTEEAEADIEPEESESASEAKLAHQADLVQQWLETGMTKICVQCDSEEELLALTEKAKAAGLITGLIRDAGRTEFNGPTYTCVAIGPAEDHLIDAITGGMRLL